MAVVPITLVITLALFALQHRGTGAMGRFFGPVMLAWFIAIGVLGAMNVAARPAVLEAASPTFAFALVARDPLRAFLTLGTVVLTITGAEALYADMGHFGRRPISRAWMVVVLPALLLCYAGQAALVLDNPDTNAFQRAARAMYDMLVDRFCALRASGITAAGVQRPPAPRVASPAHLGAVSQRRSRGTACFG